MSEDAHDDNHNSWSQERAHVLSCFDQDGIARRVKAYTAIIEAHHAEMREEPMAATEPDFLEYSEADKIIAHSLGVRLE
jgi:hypothetical protein